MAAPEPAAATWQILVVRSGGIAGIRQQWRVEPAADDDEWLALVRACPWNQTARDANSRDAFVWRIEARLPRGIHTARLPDRAVVGPWRELVNRVQSVGSHG